MSDKAKAAGGAAVGAGGVLALILKSTSAEVHVVEGVGQVGRLARVGEEGALVGSKGLAAGERGLVGAGAAAGEHGAIIGMGGVARSSGLGAAADLETFAAVAASDGKLTPFAHVADDGAKAGTKAATDLHPAMPSGPRLKPGTIVGANGKPDRIAAARYRLKDYLAKSHGEPVDAKELLDHAMDAVDLAQNVMPNGTAGTVDDEEDEVEKRFQTVGQDFKGELLPAAKHEALDGLDGATRTLLTDGHALVPALHLAPNVTTRVMGRDDRSALGRALLLGTSADAAVYLEEPSPIALPTGANSQLMFVANLMSSEAVVWEEASTTKPLVLPRLLETDRAKYNALARPTVGASRIVVIHAAGAAKP